jgi:hypothetical protein
MIDNNVINEPIEDSVYVIKSGTTEKTLIEWRQYNYYQPNTSQAALIRLQSVDEYDKKESVWIKTATFIHDKKGRVLEQTDRNGIKTSYIWGYNGLYLIAKIDNCSLNQIKNINGFENIETTHIQDCLTSIQETALRAIKESEVTTFEYIAFMGLKKMTDPTGKVIFYERDGHGKLEKIKNNDGKLLNKYSYSIGNTHTTLPNH